MGMHGVLVRVSDRQVAAIREDPERASSLLSDSGRVRSKPHRRLELGKTWDALRRGIADPQKGVMLEDAVVGTSGDKLGAPMAFGRPRYLSPKRVKELAASLDDSVLARLRERYQSGKLAGAHGGFGDLDAPTEYDDLIADLMVEELDQNWTELKTSFVELARFYRRAARRGDGMLTAIL